MVCMYVIIIMQTNQCRQMLSVMHRSIKHINDTSLCNFSNGTNIIRLLNERMRFY